MKKSLIAAVVAGTLLSGCASIVSDSNYPVTINSSPDGAKFSVTNMDNGMVIMKGTTPATVTLKASQGFFDGADYTLSFEKDGYDAQTFPLSSGIDGWYVANILFGGVIGLLIIDPATGAMWKLDNLVSVSLAESPNADPSTLSIMTLDQVPESHRSQMTRIR